jgi:dynein heavy chain
MRAVKSVLVMAGKLRQLYPDLDEQTLLINAMRDANVPKFLFQDLPLFMGIIQDLYPSAKIEENVYPELERCIDI